MNTRLLRRVWSILAVSALLSVGIWGRLVLPNPVDAVNASFEYGAEAPYIGSISEVRARSTQAVNGVVSQAAWLVVDFEYKPDFAASLVAEIEARDGTRYNPNPPVSTSCGSPLYPQLKVSCTLITEMPKSDMPGARIEFSQWSDPMAPLAVVVLGEEIVEVPDIVIEEVHV